MTALPELRVGALASAALQSWPAGRMQRRIRGTAPSFSRRAISHSLYASPPPIGHSQDVSHNSRLLLVASGIGTAPTQQPSSLQLPQLRRTVLNLPEGEGRAGVQRHWSDDDYKDSSSRQTASDNVRASHIVSEPAVERQNQPAPRRSSSGIGRNIISRGGLGSRTAVSRAPLSRESWYSMDLERLKRLERHALVADAAVSRQNRIELIMDDLPVISALDEPGPLSDDAIAEYLKQAFLDRFGSPGVAFRWLDFNRRKCISLSAWDTGLRMMNLPEELKGIKRAQLFHIVDIARKGEIDMRQWNKFFDVPVIETSSSDIAVEPKKPGASWDAESADTNDDKLTGFKGLRVLESMTKLLTDSKRPTASQAKDDMDLTGSDRQSGTNLPSLGSILSAADGGGTRRAKAKNKLVATDVEKAEEMQLEEDLQKLGLKGIRALAYIMCAKCGSLDAAFKWIDFNSKGYFARVQWETGVMVMHIDIEALTGFKAGKLFLKMGGKEGRVSKKAWDKFFANELGDDDRSMLGAVQATFQMQAKKKLLEIWKTPDARTTNSRGHADAAADASARGDSSRIAQASEQLGHSSRIGQSSEQRVHSSRTRQTSERRARAPTRQKSREQSQPTRARGRGAEVVGMDRDAHHEAQERRPFEEPAQLSTAELDAQRLVEFQGDMRATLLALAPDEGIDCGPLRRLERQLYEELAAEMGLWLGWHGQALLLYREGEKSGSIRQKFGALRTGERLLLTELPVVRWHLARAAAKDLLLCVLARSADAEDLGGLLEVVSLAGSGSREAFAEGARHLLATLKPGEILDFPPELEPWQREAIMEVTKQLGYSAHIAEGAHLSVGNLVDFERSVRAELAELEPGANNTYSAVTCAEVCLGTGALPPLVRQVLFGVAADMGLAATGLVEEGERSVKIERRAERGESAERAERAEQADQEPVSQSGVHDEEGRLQMLLDKLFEVYASKKNGVSFIRKSELHKFVNDACKLRNKRQLKASEIMADIEGVYDDTLELSVDMGSRQLHGLTRDYFRVFITKAVRVFGWTMVNFLRALLERYEQ